ncbi:group 1 truncated hemoglobin [Francisellaceae bacterium CB299]|jgi:hemoglobin
MKTLFEKLGGEAAVDAAVDKFYGKVLSDDRVKDFFKNTDMTKQIKHQKRFLTYAFGGSDTYSGKGMRHAHQHLVDKKGLNDMHFDVIVELLAGTLAEMGVADELIAEVGKVAETTRADVLCK